MEKRRGGVYKTFNFRKLVFASYYVIVFVYLVIGFMPAEAAHYDISSTLSIPSIELNSDVTTLELTDHKLNTPDHIVGSYSRAKNKTLLIGHSTTVFNNLESVSVGDEIIYDGKTYHITTLSIEQKEEINMRKLLSSAEKDTIILMTCTGDSLSEYDYTQRFIVVATI